jgi:hypothetical protein
VAGPWLARARAEKIERSPSEQYERSIGHILALIDPATKLAKLTTARCEQLRDGLLRDHSRATAQKTLKHFKGILKDAKRHVGVTQQPGP